MLCSKCSANVNPVTVFDVDGTMAKYHETLFTFCRRYWGMPNGDLCAWRGDGEFEDYIGISKEKYREAKLAFRQGGMKRFMPPHIEVVRAAVDLAKVSDVWIVTNRPWQRLDNVDPDTRFWLELQKVPYDGLLFGDDKYGDLVNIVDPERIIAVIDDLPEMVDRAKELGLSAWQIERKHNEHPTQERHPRSTIGAIETNVRAELVTWHETHG